MNTPETPGLTPVSETEVASHSVLGIVSFAMAVGTAILMAGAFLLATILSSGRVDRSQPYPGQSLVGLMVIGLCVLDVVALALGIAALFQKGAKKLFAILGVAFSGATILGTGALIILGLAYLAMNRR